MVRTKQKLFRINAVASILECLQVWHLIEGGVYLILCLLILTRTVLADILTGTMLHHI
jgi:hypothetical protein